MKSWEKGEIAEDRAFEKYGGIKHFYCNGTVPDLARICDGNVEFVEAKFIDLNAPTPLISRLQNFRRQMERRIELSPKGTKQRLFILLVNRRESGWSIKEVRDKVFRTLSDIDIQIDMEEFKYGN